MGVHAEVAERNAAVSSSAEGADIGREIAELDDDRARRRIDIDVLGPAAPAPGTSRVGHHPPLIAVAGAGPRRGRGPRDSRIQSAETMRWPLASPPLNTIETQTGKITQRRVETGAAELAADTGLAIHDVEGVRLGTERFP